MNNSDALRIVEHPAVARAVPFAIFILFIVFASLFADSLSERGFDPRWLYAARVIVVGLAFLACWESYAELRAFNSFSASDLIFSAGAGIAVFALWVNLDIEWATLGVAAGFNPTRPDGSMDRILVAFRLFGLAIVVPVMEELFWRSFLLRWIQQQDFLALDPHKIGLRANLICAALFASEHNLWLAGLFAGLVYNFIYMRTRNLWMPIISHATTNAMLGVWILATGSWQFW